MEAATSVTTDARAKRVVAPEDLLALARFCDPKGNAVSFACGGAATQDNAHREEAIAIKRFVQETTGNFASQPAPACLSKDLQEILVVAEQVRFNPNRLRLAFACREQRVWQEFDLPYNRPLSFLRVGRRFHLAPLMLALQSIAAYCVAILESGKARAFMVRGAEIQELTGRLARGEPSGQANDPRVGWSRHVGHSQTEHERGYFKHLAQQLLQLVLEQQASGLVIGCHEDLWGEVKPQFAHLEKVLLGRFHLPHFDAGPDQILRMAMPVRAEQQRIRVRNALREINGMPSRAALGVEAVLPALLAGRAQKLVLGSLPGQTISECKACGCLMAVAGPHCLSCGHAELEPVAAEEVLIRQALLSDAQILLVEADTAPAFNGAAALLRY
jgi:peptide subunit release factor 1 (eRF1)